MSGDDYFERLHAEKPRRFRSECFRVNRHGMVIYLEADGWFKVGRFTFVRRGDRVWESDSERGTMKEVRYTRPWVNREPVTIR